jgi:hypothetical protein
MFREVKSILRWEGFSFLFLCTFAIGLLAMEEFTAAKIFFWLSSAVLSVRIACEVWSRRPRKRGLALAVLAVALVGVYQWQMLAWVNRRQNQLPDNPIAEWGTGRPGTHSVYALIDTSGLGRFKNDYRLLLLWRVYDTSMEALDDTRIEKSEVFEITGQQKLISHTFTQPTMERLIPQGNVQVYALMIPNQLDRSEIASVNSAVRMGARVLGVRGMLVTTRRRTTN